MVLRSIHTDFYEILKYKEQWLIDLYTDLRSFILEIYPQSNELLYHTHALSSVYSVSEKLGDAFCMIPIYSNHLNLGFHKGTVIQDPKKLLKGTGKWIRHIPIGSISDYRNEDVQKLIQSAIELSINETRSKSLNQGLTISKIKN